MLVVTPRAVRLDRLNPGAPFLNTHSDSDLRDVIGSVVPGSAKLKDGKGIALARLKVLAPRLLEVLPDTIGGCAERLGATRREVEDASEFILDDVASRDGRLVARG